MGRGATRGHTHCWEMEREGEKEGERKRVRIVGTREKDELDRDIERDNGRDREEGKRDGVKEERKKRDGDDDEDVDIQLCRLCSGNREGRPLKELIREGQRGTQGRREDAEGNTKTVSFLVDDGVVRPPGWWRGREKE